MEPSISDWIDTTEKGKFISDSKRLAMRLRYLLEVSREEDPEQAPLDIVSLKGFLAFLANAPRLAYPDVVLTADGEIWAEWRQDRNHHFAILFLNDEDVRFVVFAPNPKRPYKTTRVSGTSTVDSVLDEVRPYRVLEWAGAVATEAA